MRRRANCLLVFTLSLLTTACATAPATGPAPTTIPATIPAPTEMPALTTITAVFLDGETPTVLVHPCADALVSGIVVTDISIGASPESTGSPSANPTDFQLWAVAADPGSNAINQVHLLQTPPGWHVQSDISDVITEFRPEHTYWVIASTTDPTQMDAGVKFRLDDLASLTDGQVWAASRPSGQASGMTRDEFVDYATRSCPAIA
jgi:hypothetical protein